MVVVIADIDSLLENFMVFNPNTATRKLFYYQIGRSSFDVDLELFNKFTTLHIISFIDIEIAMIRRTFFNRFDSDIACATSSATSRIIGQCILADYSECIVGSRDISAPVVGSADSVSEG